MAWPIREYCTGSREFARVRESSQKFSENTRADTRKFAKVRKKFAKVRKSSQIYKKYTSKYAQIRESSQKYAKIRINTQHIHD